MGIISHFADPGHPSQARTFVVRIIYRFCKHQGGAPCAQHHDFQLRAGFGSILVHICEGEALADAKPITT